MAMATALPIRQSGLFGPRLTFVDLFLQGPHSS